jgi:hypothetical protein
LALKNLSRNLLLKVSLGLVEQGLTAISLAGEGWHQISSLKSHVKLEVSDVLAEIFPFGGGIGLGLRLEHQDDFPL